MGVMMVSYLDLLSYVGPIVIGSLGWWIRSLKADVDRNSKELHELALKVAEEYVHKNTLNEIRDYLVRIESKLDSKQDKP